MNKKILLGLLSIAPVALASCGSTTTSTHSNADYAGYEVDLNGDGTIASDEQNLTWADSYDTIISKIKKTTDNETRFKLMHAAETELMSTGAICPLYYYTDLFLKSTDMTGFYSMPLGYKFFYGAQVKGSGAFTVCIASEPTTIDPALNSTVDGGTYDEHLFEGLYRWSYEGDYPNGAVKLVPGLAKAAPVEVDNADGTVTYTYTLRDGLKWSDGTDLTAGDIARSWKRAVSTSLGADYAYLFEIVKGGTTAETESDGASLAVEATNDTTLVVTLENSCSYWNELTAFPAFAPVPTSADNDGAWCTSKNSSTFVCNGPMKIKSFDSTKIELEPNPYYYDTDIVKATDITFAFSDSDSGMYNSYSSGSYAFIDSFPTSMISTLKGRDDYFNVGQLGTYYVCFNVNSSAFDAVCDTEEKREKLRKALSLLIDRNYLVDSVTQGGQKPANGFVSEGLTEADGATDWTAKNGPKGDGAGYYSVDPDDYDSNVSEAISLLKEIGYTYDETTKKFTDVPAFEYLYNTSDSHKLIATYLQGVFSKYGITMNLANQEWASFITTRKSGDYTVARNGWLCDYNDPISMLDMWITNSGNNDARLGKAD
ncbi:MAG: ABC transporter substrate-binding protein [Bacilli bacterium]|jgi:oligopeptide transport system substrate-binding protein|nr:ABC transporter substrate-binding protein [Bacilli bacterium]MCI2055388.1 ABC transporter substrate-binding protein [Bacilli bacterium]